MEKKEATATSNPLGICEKVFNALKINPMLRPLRRISYSLEPPVVPAVSPRPPSADPGTKVVSAETKLPLPVKPKPIMGTPNSNGPEKQKVAEVAPNLIKPTPTSPAPPPTKERVKPTSPPLTTQEIGQVPRVASKARVEQVLPPPAREKEKVSRNPLPLPSPVGEKEKPMTKVEVPALPASAGGQGKAKVANVEPTSMAVPRSDRDRDRAGPKAAIENINERVGDYIHRAKLRLKADANASRFRKSDGS